MVRKRRLYPPDWVTARGNKFARQWRKGIEIDAMIESLGAPLGAVPDYLKPAPKRRKRGWWGKYDSYGDNPFKSCIDESEKIAAARAACNALTDGARVKGAEANSAKAARVRACLLHEHRDEIDTLPDRGVSHLAKILAPQFSLGVSTMRRHIVAVKKLLTPSLERPKG